MVMRCGSAVIDVDVPDALQRAGVAAQNRGPDGDRDCAETWAPAQQRTAEGALRCVRGTRLECSAPLSPYSSLRAQRSNPESLRGKTLDCFAALAMTGQGAASPSSNADFNLRTRLCSLAARFAR